MNFCKIHSAQATLLHAEQIDIEVDISPGLHTFNIIGLPDKAVEESGDRVASAIKNSGFISPKQKNHKTIISLAPADIKKVGPAFDVAIGLGYLKSTRQIFFDTQKKLFVGELSLNGELKKINGILPILLFAQRAGFKEVCIPEQNMEEASLIQNIKIYYAKTFLNIVQHLQNKQILPSVNPINFSDAKRFPVSDELQNIIGQEKAKRGLAIAAAGGHNIAFYGPPGTGKTMLAKTLASLLPRLKHDQIIECSSIHSKLVIDPPLRSPHHTSSHTAIIGGGPQIQAGEITLAHNGVLFLDEFPEFNRRVIESLREPLEQGTISISRSSDKITLPSNFILVVTLNPCPCGYFETGIQPCTCTPHNIQRYRRKISGPIIDRIDMWVEVSNILFSTDTGRYNSPGKDMGSKIIRARLIQKQRFGSVILNKEIITRDIKKYFKLDEETLQLLVNSANTLKLSTRSYYKIISLAQTIADIDSETMESRIKKEHILEALQYRSKFI